VATCWIRFPSASGKLVAPDPGSSPRRLHRMMSLSSATRIRMGAALGVPLVTTIFHRTNQFGSILSSP
jgi:hypothetical protein